MKEEKKDTISCFVIKIESMVPATAIYHVFAHSPEEAAHLVKGKIPKEILYAFPRKKEKELKVFKLASSIVEFTKKYF